MTEDYKTKMLKWLSGTYTIGTGSNVPQFSALNTNANNNKQVLSAKFPNGFFYKDLIQGNDNSNNGTPYTIMTGGYYTDTTTSNYNGFIAVLDNSLNILQIITEYSTGTKFGDFIKLNVGNDGNFFGIENNSGTLRFIMLNNITAKLPTSNTYQVILRQSYNMQGILNSTTSTIVGIIKSPGQARYAIYGTYQSSGHDQPGLTELQVNVGSTNTWTDYTVAVSTTTDDYIDDCLPSWAANNFSFKMIGFQLNNSSLQFSYTEYISSGSTTMTKATIGSTFSQVRAFNGRILNSTDTYLEVTDETTTNDTINIYKVDYSSNTLTNIYSITGAQPMISVPDFENGVTFYKTGNELELKIAVYPLGDTTGATLTWYFGKIVGNNVYVTNIGNYASKQLTFFYVSRQYNLYTYYTQADNTAYYVTQIYNENNYNGVTYQDLISLIPTSATLYNSSSIPMFANNLYNLTINNNIVNATLDVPNNYINGTNFTSTLFGGTNNIIVADSKSYSKNIYEELLINFINLFIMTNQNDSTNIIYNQVGANRITTSTNSTQDYNNAKIGYVRLNYSDSTYKDILPTIVTNEAELLTQSSNFFAGTKTTFTIGEKVCFQFPINTNTKANAWYTGVDGPIYLYDIEGRQHNATWWGGKSFIFIYSENSLSQGVITAIEEVGSNNYSQITFLTYKSSTLQNAQILSNDKATIYCTIDLTSYADNSFYSFNQKLKVI